MILTLDREELTERSTIGSLYVDGDFSCYTLEDPVREGPKIPGNTAIPAGRYEVAVNYSMRFRRLMPLLLNVPGFEGIRIHSGNTSADTEGCILVGNSRGMDRIGDSRAAFSTLFPLISRAIMSEKVWIEIGGAHTKAA